MTGVPLAATVLFVGGPIMIALIALLFQRFLKPAMVEHARAEADRGARSAEWKDTPRWT